MLELQEQSDGEEAKADEMGLQIRNDALREAALSMARGGLAYRTYEIQRRLVEYDTSPSKVFDFSPVIVACAFGASYRATHCI